MKKHSAHGRSHIKAAILAAALGTGFIAAASGSEVNTGYFGNVAIEGYDPVAYFTDGKPTKGSDAITHLWQGAVWQFASEEHRALFIANPEAYAPQFGGLCSEGVAFHEVTANIEPDYWEIVDGRLYLTAATGFADLAGNLPAAVENWPEVHSKLAQ